MCQWSVALALFLAVPLFTHLESIARADELPMIEIGGDSDVPLLHDAIPAEMNPPVKPRFDLNSAPSLSTLPPSHLEQLKTLLMSVVTAYINVKATSDPNGNILSTKLDHDLDNHTLRLNFQMSENNNLSVHAHLSAGLDEADVEARYYRWDGIVPGIKVEVSTLGMVSPEQSLAYYSALVQGYLRLIVDDFPDNPVISKIALVPTVSYGYLDQQNELGWSGILNAKVTFR